MKLLQPNLHLFLNFGYRPVIVHIETGNLSKGDSGEEEQKSVLSQLPKFHQFQAQTLICKHFLLYLLVSELRKRT